MKSSQFLTTSEVVETTTAKKIRKLLGGTAKRSQFSYMFGPTGRGKTFVSRDWIERYGNAAYVRIRTGATMSRLRKQVSEVLFGDEKASQADIIRYIIERPGFVLVIDEATHLIVDSDYKSGKNLDFLRDIYDEVNENGGSFGICFIFTDYSLGRLKNSRLGMFLKQFINRGDNHLNIGERISKPYEIARLLEVFQPDADEAMVDEAHKIACEGGIRALVKRLSVLQELNSRIGTPIIAEKISQLQAQYDTGEYQDE